jgi:hypothetical protein
MFVRQGQAVSSRVVAFGCADVFRSSFPNSSFPNSVWERDCLRRNAAAEGGEAGLSNSVSPPKATELQGQLHSQTEFGNERSRTCARQRETRCRASVSDSKAFAPRSQVALGNAIVSEALLPPLVQTQRKHSFQDKLIPKCNLGTRRIQIGAAVYDRRPRLFAVMIERPKTPATCLFGWASCVEPRCSVRLCRRFSLLFPKLLVPKLCLGTGLSSP